MATAEAREPGRLPERLLESQDAFFAVDRDWRISHCNRAATSLLQRPREALLDRSLWLTCPELSGTTFEQQVRRAAAERERVEFEEFHPPRAIWLEVIVEPWAEGLAVSLRDISERKRRERRELCFRVAADAIATAPTMRAAMSAFASSIAALTGWPYAETWGLGPAPGSLRCLDVVHAGHPGYDAFEALTRSLELGPGVGLVGEAFAGKVPRVFPDLHERGVQAARTAGAGPACPGRFVAGDAAGFRTGLVVPIFAHEQPVGAVAFFSSRGADDDWFRVLQEQRQIGLLFERRYAQDAMRVSEERYRLLFENSPAPMWIYAPDTLRFLDVNQPAIALYGYSREEFLALSLREIRPAEDLPGLELAHDPRRDKQGWWSGTWRHLKKGGVPFYVKVTSHGLKLDERLVRVAVITDMTAEREAAGKLREQATLLDSANDAIVVQGLDGVVTYWNRGAERSYGRSAAEALGQPFARLTAPRGETFLLASQTLARTGEWMGELTHALPGKREAVLATRWSYVRDERGAPRAILSIGTDITERKKLEAQYLRAQRMESIGTLAGGIAHDLNNMLTPILMSVSFLRAPNLDKDQLETLDAIEQSARRGADMVRQVLLFARGVSGERQPLRPEELLQDTVRIIIDSMPKTIEVRLAIADGLPWIEADPTQLQQVLINLAVNARDAMPAGGVLTLGAQAARLDGSYVAMNPLARVGEHVAFEVTDTGSGIPPEIRDRIFDPFFTTKEVGKGTGLGLATSLAIVKSHGGFFNVYSEPDKGSTFKIYLPAQTEPDEAAAGEKPEVKLPRGDGELVLLVDDEELIRSVARRTLEAFGYRVIEAANGAEALAAHARAAGAVQLVLMDMSMPVMDGSAAIRALRHLQSGLRIIATSGLGENGAFAGASNAGVHHYLQKPYTASALLETVRDALHGP